MIERVIAAKEALTHNKSQGGGNNGKSDGKRKRSREDDNEEKDNADGEQESKKRRKPCPLHKRRDGRCNHEFKTCSANPHPENANFKLNACKNVLGWKDVVEKFPWYVEQCKKHRGLTISDGTPKNRNRNPRNDSRNEERQQPPQQQQYQFEGLPANLPVGTTIVLPTSTPAPNSYAPTTPASNSSAAGPNSFFAQVASGGAGNTRAAQQTRTPRWMRNNRGALELM